MNLFIGKESYSQNQLNSAINTFDTNFDINNDSQARNGLRDLLRFIIIMPESQLN
ncbi:MAG: hypothetical protein MK033_01330 [Candidatus Caenarcaniphilales bacterium]|nr:hypothetical protein [Candidatus Caenarcaniphilales bacterium]